MIKIQRLTGWNTEASVVTMHRGVSQHSKGCHIVWAFPLPLLLPSLILSSPVDRLSKWSGHLICHRSDIITSNSTLFGCGGDSSSINSNQCLPCSVTTAAVSNDIRNTEERSHAGSVKRRSLPSVGKRLYGLNHKSNNPGPRRMTLNFRTQWNTGW